MGLRSTRDAVSGRGHRRASDHANARHSVRGRRILPGRGHALYDLLPCPKTLVTFTAAEGAAEHNAPLAPQRRNQVVFDWLDTTLKVQG